ncbi:hypothetical protein FNF27_03059 [Cafeteria roenbergensis]|uniref:Uncharacterized protein n=2 Tax=Cafeteria roenbergensis TaxID=33653 RepID=A0A5A8EBX6_CAFRO|nr:hypothetical protein FNF29_05091 [Cafeteria roenbergensis]KAA0167217.1 hypothetical protein FNF31_01102 [Cafeteria roenbergensis]KAA0168783.1 hypothetical protein FNF28_02331 [Cafeteria roenbergensis]KAA0175356.1 hypothetical protein FNF27_03059 [Cafeteria roenbergensis]|eukprot:KAA0150756.1 hypothetical protein FNF29_05091 [Cafeteria roenbergensis]
MTAKRLPRRMRWRKPMSPKHGNKDFYKGTGGHKFGVHTTKGGYVMLPHKAVEYVAPNLSGFNLTPYVAHNTPKLARPDVSVAPAAEAAEGERS